LLDEPTNHLALDILEAFEQALLDFPGPLLAVSHDRWFIDRFGAAGGKVWELRDGRLIQHAGNAAAIISEMTAAASTATSNW
jgi:macrolide transport system ATP-binding/permease protein